LLERFDQGVRALWRKVIATIKKEVEISNPSFGKELSDSLRDLRKVKI
jgi:hypothetical protein